VDKKIFCFWTGENEVPEIRQKSVQSLSNSGLEVCLVTSQTLENYVPEADLHPTYRNLSLVHRSDYLRAYFMHHFGGAYCDIKRVDFSWRPVFDQLAVNPDLIGAGYREIHRHGVANVHQTAQLMGSSRIQLASSYVRWRWMQLNYSRLIGNCAFIFRPATEFTQFWWEEVNARLDRVAPALRKHPSTQPKERMKTIYEGTISSYPVPWSYLLGDVLQPLALRYHRKILRSLPAPDFQNYE